MVIAAIGRDTSTTHILGRQIVEICERHGAEVDFVTPTELALPVNDGTVPFDLPAARAWQQRVADHSAFIWISPEYHGAMTGGMKNLFDHLGKEPMRRAVVGLCALAGGAMAALNTLNNMTVVARSLGAWVAPDCCAYNSNEVKVGLDERALARLDAMCASVIDTARRLAGPGPGSVDLDLAGGV